MKKYIKLFIIIFLSSLIGLYFYINYQSPDNKMVDAFQKTALQSKSNKHLKEEDIKLQNVQICAAVGQTCDSNAVCKTGDCYAGVCEPCQPAGMACQNDGNCCKSNCVNGFV